MLLLLLLILCYPLAGQKFMDIKDKTFNLGAKIGFNSSFPVINSLAIDGVEAENIHVQYKVGYMASFFCRVNIEKFFIQPSISWQMFRGNLNFITPVKETSSNVPNMKNPLVELEMKSRTLEVPVLIGYNLVKEKPYGLSLMAGPVFKYNYKVDYATLFDEQSNKYANDSTPFGINIAAGIGVTIGRLLLDFTYEFGLNEVRSNFTDKSSPTPVEGHIFIDKRTNVMSFALGFLF